MPRGRPDSRQTTFGSGDTSGSALEDLPTELQGSAVSDGPVLAALRLIASGVPEEEAARSLTWKDFESFCAQLLRASGYTVTENLYLSHPRAQIDLVARGPLFVINLDCKHWKRAPSYSVLEGIALAQLRRSHLLRRRLNDSKPIVSGILSFSEPAGSFIEGVAVVPLRALRSFLETVESYYDVLELS
jgi:hypothetical protein